MMGLLFFSALLHISVYHGNSVPLLHSLPYCRGVSNPCKKISWECLVLYYIRKKLPIAFCVFSIHTLYTVQDCNVSFVINEWWIHSPQSGTLSCAYCKLTNLLIITCRYTTVNSKATKSRRKLGNSRTSCLGNIRLVPLIVCILIWDLRARFFIFFFFPLHGRFVEEKKIATSLLTHTKREITIIRSSCRTPVITFIFIA